MKNLFTHWRSPFIQSGFSLRTAVPFFFIFLFTSVANSQAQPRTHYRKIATGEVQERLMKENPEMAESRRAIGQHTARFQKTGGISEVTIPVIFYIFYPSWR